MKTSKLLLVLLVLLFSLTACNETEVETPSNIEPHVHEYTYDHDSRNHFLKCICGDEKDYAPHAFIEVLNGNSMDEKCTICSYQKKSKNLIQLVDGIKYINNLYYITSAEGLMNFAKIINGTLDEYPRTTFQTATVRLVSDIDMKDYQWTPIAEEISYTYEEHYHKDNFMEGMIFDGCGYTISNLTITGERSVAFIGITSSSFTIQNVIFDKANVTASSGWVSVVVGYSSNNLELKNITVKNSFIGGETAYKIGGLVGMGQLAFGQIIVTDCKVANVTFDGVYSVSGLVGELTGSERATFTNNIVSRCNFSVKDGDLKASPFAVWDSNYMSLDRSQNLNYFNSGTNCANNLNEGNDFIYGK